MNTHIVLAMSKKGTTFAAYYVTMMKNLADEMAGVEKPLEDEEFNSYILTGLCPKYYQLVTSIVTHVEPILFTELSKS